jgi:predicted nucleotidyltransferase component of viral defense system
MGGMAVEEPPTPSRVLTPHQKRVASIIGSSIGDLDFALAGGAALISKDMVDRRTQDLDFFGPSEAALGRLLPAVLENLAADGFGVEVRQQSATFIRMSVQTAEEETEVDLAVDARLFPAESGELSPVLSSEELAVDKVLAVFGRAEARDFVDLAASRTLVRPSSALELGEAEGPRFRSVEIR